MRFRLRTVGPQLRTAAFPLLVLILAALIATGCVGGSAAAKDGGIVIHMTAGRDPTGIEPKLVQQCNAKAKGRYRIEQLILPPTVDAQREQMIRRLAGRDAGIDVLALDVIWTAEFVEANWLVDLSKRIEPVKEQYLPATLATVEYEGKYWAVPIETNVAMLYYRKDLVKTPPKTWEELEKTAKAVMAKKPGMAGFLWQANQYEGLTVDAMEFILQQGGNVLSEDGKKAVLDEGDGARKAFAFMRHTFTSGLSPKAVTTFQEEESRQMFQQGKAVFLRNWPYVYSLSQAEGSKVIGKVGVVPLPMFEGQKPAAVLGGKNYAISRFSRHKEEAWDAIQCMSSPEALKMLLIGKGNLPSLSALYDDPESKRKMPFLSVARASLDGARPRPVTPYYNDVTYALNRGANAVATGRLSPEAAVKRIDRSVQLAIEGNGEI